MNISNGPTTPSHRGLSAGLALLGGAALIALACDVEDLEADLEGSEVLVADDDDGDGSFDPAGPPSLAMAREFSHVLGGWGFAGWGTTSDELGVQISTTGDGATCFLAGVAGNLSKGSELNYSGESQGIEARARVPKFSAGYRLIAHGGAYTSTQDGFREWADTPVNAQATCVFNATNVASAQWKAHHNGEAGVVAAPVKITDLAVGRQCFLSGVWGVDGGRWDQSASFARVRKILVPDLTHPTTGWYVEGNTISTPYRGDHTRVEARCADFPADTVIHTPPAINALNILTPLTVSLTSGSGIKACALTEIQGAFKYNNWTNGALLIAPGQVDGNWTATVSPGKAATFVCLK